MLCKESHIDLRTLFLIFRFFEAHQMLHVFPDHIIFQIYDIARLLREQRRLLSGVRDDGYLKPVGTDCCNRQTDAVDRN